MTADSINIVTNAVCNVVIFISMLAFIVFCFGRSDSVIYKYGSLQAYGLKFGLITICLGSLANLLTLSDPPFSELVLNIGLAALFMWAAIFHYFVFVAKKQPGKPISKAQLQKSNKNITIGSTWIVSLMIQIVNMTLVGYLISLCSASLFFNVPIIIVMCVCFALVQGWSFYAIFKTLKIRSLSNAVKSRAKKKRASNTKK